MEADDHAEGRKRDYIHPTQVQYSVEKSTIIHRNWQLQSLQDTAMVAVSTYPIHITINIIQLMLVLWQSHSLLLGFSLGSKRVPRCT